MPGRLRSLQRRVGMLDTTIARPSLAGESRIRGSTLQVIRQRILERDGYQCRCARCRASGQMRPATIVDHTVPLWAGGPDADNNRTSINVDCHKAKSHFESGCRSRGSFEPWTGV